MKLGAALVFLAVLPASSATIFRVVIDEVFGTLPSSFVSGQDYEFSILSENLGLSQGIPLVLVDVLGGVNRGSSFSLSQGLVRAGFEAPFIESIVAEDSINSLYGSWVSGPIGHRESFILEGFGDVGYTQLEVTGAWDDSSLVGLEGVFEESVSFLSGTGSYRWSEAKPLTGVPIHFPQPDYSGVNFTIQSIVIPEPSISVLLMFCAGLAFSMRSK